MNLFLGFFGSFQCKFLSQESLTLFVLLLLLSLQLPLHAHLQSTLRLVSMRLLLEFELLLHVDVLLEDGVLLLLLDKLTLLPHLLLVLGSELGGFFPQ